MKIGVLSDTHTDSLERLPKKLVDDLSGMDLVIHAGDFTGKRLVDGLRKLGPFRGVYGNIDGPEVRRELPAVDTVEAGGFKIGVNHPSEGGPPKSIEERIRAKFTDVQVIIHGHSHQTKNIVKNGVLWFNPGSATGTFPANAATYGVLHLDKEIRGEIITL
jgi:uncharacterized protein